MRVCPAYISNEDCYAFQTSSLEDLSNFYIGYLYFNTYILKVMYI